MVGVPFNVSLLRKDFMSPRVSIIKIGTIQLINNTYIFTLISFTSTHILKVITGRNELRLSTFPC